MNNSEKVLTSVKIDPKLWDEFRISCVRHKFSFQKLSERAIHLYLTDPSFRQNIHSHHNIEIVEGE